MSDTEKKVRSFRMSEWQLNRLKAKWQERNTWHNRSKNPRLQDMLDEAITVYIMSQTK